MGIVIRNAELADLDAIVTIEKYSIVNPWSRQMFADELRSGRGLNLVAQAEEEIAGYLFSMLVPPEIHLLDIAVSARFRRQGVGRRLMHRMFEIAQRQGCDMCTLEVRSGNETAIKFYEKFKFLCKGVRKGYYQDTGEDALILWTE